MARPRRNPPGGGGASSAWQRRNARAQAAGYRNYYDYRTRGTAAGSPERARARGHRGSADLVRSLKPGDVIVVPEGLPQIPKRGDKYQKIEVMVLRDDGRSERFTIRRRTYDQMTGLLEKMAAKGAMFSPSPSLDLRRIVRVADRPDVEEDEDE